MAVFCGAFPVLPGKVEAARAFAKEAMGPQRSGFDESQRRGGIAARDLVRSRRRPTATHWFWCGLKAPILKRPSPSSRRTRRSSPSGSASGSRTSAGSISPNPWRAGRSWFSTGGPNTLESRSAPAAPPRRIRLPPCRVAAPTAQATPLAASEGGARDMPRVEKPTRRGVELGRLAWPPPPTQEAQAVERVLGPARVNALLTRGTTRLRVETMLRAAAETGLRRGEAIGLRWPDVNLVERRLEVRRSVWQATGPDGRPTKGVKTAKDAAIAASRFHTRSLHAWPSGTRSASSRVGPTLPGTSGLGVAVSRWTLVPRPRRSPERRSSRGWLTMGGGR